MRQCHKCGVVKPLSGFNKDKSRSSGYTFQCKSCQAVYRKQYHIDNIQKEKKYAREYRASKTLPYWIVYMLPNADNYVGKTNNPYWRIKEHVTRHKRDTSGWVELHRFDTEKEALAKEAEYHDKGYPGRNANYRRQHKIA